MTDRIDHDGVLIVGAGLAGLSAALAAAPAQGAGADRRAAEPRLLLGLGPGRHGRGARRRTTRPTLHAADTVAAGAGLVRPGHGRGC